MAKNKDALEESLSRKEVATLLHCHTETLKRREKQGKLHPLYYSTRMVRYRLSEVLALQREAMQGGSDILRDVVPTSKAV